MLAIETNNLTKKFKEFKAVDNLNLKVPEGSIFGFLGPNGAGKTTTIKMLVGLSKPSGGSIKIYGNEVRFGSLKNRMDIGFLPDVPSFYNWMTPVGFLEFVGDLFYIEKKVLKSRIENVLDLVGLGNINKKIGGFSRGMKQRLGIAQALINEPKVIFLDEPVSALDPIGRKEVMEVIQKLSGKVTVLFSTHILSDIERVCDSVAILDKGRIMTEDSMDNLRSKYSNRVITIEIEEYEKTPDFIGRIEKSRWLDKFQISDNGELKVFVNNMVTAQREIPEIIIDTSSTLRKFLIEEPTLEDIFLKVVDVQ